MSFYKELVKFVAGVLVASGKDQAVNATLSSIAFDQNGIVYNQQLSLSPATSSDPGVLDYYLNVAGDGLSQLTVFETSGKPLIGR